MRGESWWTGTRLVAMRAIRDATASRTWRVVTAVILLLGVAIVVVPRLIGGSETRYTLAAVQGTDKAIGASLSAAGQAGGFAVDVVAVADEAAARAAVQDGTATVAYAPGPEGGTLFVATDAGGAFPALVARAVGAQATYRALLDAGLAAEEIARIQALPAPQQVTVGRVADEGRAAVGFAVGIVLYLALILTGTAIANAVASEKTTRISEVLLAVLRPSQLLVGTVLGVGLLSLLQVSLLVVPAVVSLPQAGSLGLSSAAVADVVLGIVWFVLGLALYAFVFAALATLVEKVTEVGAVTMPVNFALIGSYLLAALVTVQDPDAWSSVAASLFPLSAPMVMPVRWASGVVPPWQLALAMALTAATAVLLALIASRIYARGLTMTGRRLKLREVLRG